MKIRVKIPSEKDPRFKSWARTVDFVKIEYDNAYAFEGDWLRRGNQTELALGTVVLLYDETGSRQKQVSKAEIHRVEESGLSLIMSASGIDWAMQLRDDVAELLQQELPPPDLSDIDTQHLISELLLRVDTSATDYDFRDGMFDVKPCGDCNCIKVVSLELDETQKEQRRKQEALQSAAAKINKIQTIGGQAEELDDEF
jgi:hypothetical protein